MPQNARNFQFNYRKIIRDEWVGPVSLKVSCIENLNDTIDALFAALQKEGDEELLESLCPYFGVIWPSARALAEHLAAQFGNYRRPSEGGGAQRERFLEIGCGLALPSLVLASLGYRVTAADFHPEVPHFLSENLALNRLSERLTYLDLDWRQDLRGHGKFDWIYGSDILYEKEQPERVAQLLAESLTPDGTAIIADPGRPYLQSFVDAMRDRGLEQKLIPLRNIFLMEFQRKAI